MATIACWCVQFCLLVRNFVLHSCFLRCFILQTCRERFCVALFRFVLCNFVARQQCAVEREDNSSLHRVCKLLTGSTAQTILLGSRTTGLTLLGLHTNDQLPLACLYLKIHNVPPHGETERSTADVGFETNAAFAKVFKFFAADTLATVHVRSISSFNLFGLFVFLETVSSASSILFGLFVFLSCYSSDHGRRSIVYSN
jgi:hypothetical protein